MPRIRTEVRAPAYALLMAFDPCHAVRRSEPEVETIVSMALEEAGVEPPEGISFAAFEAALSVADLSGMQVDVCS